MRQQRVCVFILLFSGKSGKNVSRERNCATLRFPSERIFYNWQSFQFDCCVVQCIECFARVLTIITLFKHHIARCALRMQKCTDAIDIIIIISFYSDFSNKTLPMMPMMTRPCISFPSHLRYN